MLLRQNVSAFLSNWVEGKRQDESARELGISRASLHAILTGSCNPRLSTLEEISDCLEIDPVLLLSYGMNDAELEILGLMPELLSRFMALSPEKRCDFIALFAALAQIWNESQA